MQDEDHSLKEIVRAEGARMRALADALPQMIWTFSSVDGAATYTNERFRDFYGPIDPARSERIRLNHPDDAVRMEAAWSGAVERGEAYAVEGRLRRKDGVYRWHKLVIAPVFKGSDITEWLATALDIDEIVSARETYADTSTILKLAQDSAGAGLWEWEIEKGVVRHSATSARMHGLVVGERETVEMTVPEWEACVHPDDLAEIWAAINRTLATGCVYTGEFRTRGVDGRARRLQAFGQMILDKQSGQPSRFVGLHLDVTAQREAEESSRRLSLQDTVTQLANRHAFGEHLKRCCEEARAGGSAFAVLVLDLDRFKAINDTFGHPTGDSFLKAVGARIQAIVGAGDHAARLGGDEFVVVLSSVSGRAQAECAARTLISEVCRPLELDGRSLTVGISIGIALGPLLGESADELFKRADIALFKAKAAGRGRWMFYEAGMEADLAERNLLALDMRDALQSGAFELHYQPIMKVEGAYVSCCEALMRWTHPTKGSISPAVFIPLAEETGLIVQLGAWALRHACREAATWPARTNLAVNVSAAQFRQAGFEQVVIEALAASGLAPQCLELEITESVLVSEDKAVLETLTNLDAIGVRVALDDFGTGYSSLAYLHRFSFDKIKIDRSFVQGIGDKHKAAIVRAVVGIGASLGIPITAEGVETEAELACVVAEGCSEIQGFLFSRPLAADALRWFLGKNEDKIGSVAKPAKSSSVALNRRRA